MGRFLPRSAQDSVCILWQAAESLCAQSERNKSMKRDSLQWAVSGVGLPCGKARLFRWKMVLRLVSLTRVRGRPACRTAWFMRVVISAVATWINHVARIKLLLNDAQHFPRCLNHQWKSQSWKLYCCCCCVVAVSRGRLLQQLNLLSGTSDN